VRFAQLWTISWLLPFGDLLAEQHASTEKNTSFPEYAALANGAQKIPLLPGQHEFVFSMYGSPGELEPLKQLVDVMRNRSIGNGFDPGPRIGADENSLVDYLVYCVTQR